MIYLTLALKQKLRDERRKREDQGKKVSESMIVVEALNAFFSKK